MPKTTYKVWIEIEEYDEDAKEGENITPFDLGCSGTFDTPEKALAFAKELHGYRHESGTE